MKNNYHLKPACIFIGVLLFSATFFSCKNGEKDNIKKNKSTELTEEETGGKYDKQYMLEEMYKQWDDMQRDPGTGRVPVERLYAAYQHTRNLLQSKKQNTVTSGVSGVKWTSRGPSNVGGRTRAIMISPLDLSGNTGFAGAVGGGIWKSTNLRSANPSWSPVNDFMQNLAISYITYDPSNKSVFYAGTGEGFGNSDAARGLGIIKSTDGGATWNFLASTNNSSFYYVNKVAVNSSGHIYAATRSGIFRSLDGGASWGTAVLSGNFGDIEITSTDVYYASKTQFPATIYKSSTGASGSWTNLGLSTSGTGLPSTHNQRVETAVAPSDPNTVYALYYRDTSYTFNGTNYTGSTLMYRSTNGGTSFVNVGSPNDADPGIPDPDFTRTQGWYDLILKVDPNNSQTVYTGGIDIFKSTNGGGSWKQLTHWYAGFNFQYCHADQHGMEFQPNNSDVLYFTNDGGIAQTTNATAAAPVINPINTNFTVTQFYACDYHPAALSNYFLAGAQDNGTQQFNLPAFGGTVMASGGDGNYCNIDKLDPNNQFTQYVYNNYYRSNDGGASFPDVAVPSDIATSGRFINPSDYDANTKTLYAASNTGQFMRWKDAPTTESFELVAVIAMTGQVSAVAVASTTPDKVYFGTGNGQIVEVTDASLASGSTPGRSLGTPSGGYVNSIWEDPANAKHIIIAYSNYGVQNVWETVNADAAAPTWVSKDGDLPDMPVYSILVDPLNINNVFIGTELGVYSASNFSSASPQWVPTSDNLAYTRVTQLKLRTSDNLVVASTHGRGLFTSDVFQSAAAGFYADAKFTYQNKDVSFFDNSVKATSWQWDFNNDGIFENTEQNPVQQFTTPGIKTVRLRINGDPLLESITTINVLPNKGTPYLLENGGNFDVSTGDFFADNKGTSLFSLGNSTQPGKDGTHSGANAWVIDINNPVYAPNSTAFLYSPEYKCTTAGSYTVSFYAKYKIETTWDGFRVEYSTDKGSTWQILGNVLQANWYDYANLTSDRPFPMGEAYFSNVNAANYTLCKFTTNDFAGQSSVAFRIVFQSDPAVVYAGLAIDDFTLDGPSNIVLPVSLVSFTGKNIGNNNNLQWKTGSEINSNRYEVERSFEGRLFDKITTIKSRNSATGSIYTVADNISSIKTNNFYYRLKIIDNDGAAKYSPVVYINIAGRKELISVLGNLTNGPVKVIVPASLLNTPLQADIVAANGVAVKRVQLTGVTNTLNFSQFAAGNYFIRFIKDGQIIQSEKVVRQ